MKENKWIEIMEATALFLLSMSATVVLVMALIGGIRYAISG